MTDPKSPASAPTLDETLRLIPGPVAVIGAVKEGLAGGLTAAWLTRVSMDPPLLLVAVGHTRFTWELLQGARQFTVSLLAADQVPEARLFGLKSRREIDKWGQTAHVLLGEGIPALEHCSARFLCELDSRFTAGDHDCLVGRIVSGETVAGGPALPMRGSDYAPRSGD